MDTETSYAEVVAGMNASLPCTIRVPLYDSPLLTLWYKGENETPVYSYDQRTGVSGTSWSDPKVFGGRAHYLAHLSPPAMLIMRAAVEDAQIYRCRIDFYHSNSRVAWIRLRVIVPPERVEIIPQLSPVLPGQKDDVVCSAVGGNPSPSVVWLQSGRVVDPNSTVGQSGSYNRLEVPVSREDLHNPFTCEASNNDVLPPVVATYTRNVTCGPARILLGASENPLVEGRPAKISCTAIGSNPPALITWFQQGKAIQKHLINVTRQDNETASIFSLLPSRHHHGRQLLCRADNPILPLATLEDIITLNVAYRPHVRINIGWPRRMELLTEGSDLTLECIVDSSPPPYKIQFFHAGEEISPNKTEVEGVEVNDALLSIQHVKRDQAGRYHCKASNVQGDAVSKSIDVSVRYTPLCVSNSTIMGAVVGQTSKITCQVYAYPSNVNFTWMFTSDAATTRARIMDAEDYTCDGLTSVLSFTPRSTEDFGSFSCYATNKLGIQQQPCAFILMPAVGPPERVHNCSIAKVTTEAIGIFCNPLEGGRERSPTLPRQYLHQIRVESTGELVFNRSSSEASLEVDSLYPGQKYIVSVTAFNAHGKASPTSFHVQTLQEAKLHIMSSQPTPPEHRPVVWIMGAGAGVTITLGMIFLVLWKTHGRRSSHTLRNRDLDNDKANNTQVSGDAREMGDGLCVNGLMQQTIYDSSGRYRGFAHLQQMESFSVLSSSNATPSPQPEKEKPTLQSRFSLLRKESLLTKGSKATAAECDDKDPKDASKSGPNNDEKRDEVSSKQVCVDSTEELNGTKKSGFIRWKWAMKNVSGSGENSRFLDLCRVTESKHLRQNNKNSESAL